MFETIVIGVDGRDGGEDALRLARRLAAPGSRLLAVRVARDDAEVAAADHAVLDLEDRHPGIEADVFVADEVADGLCERAASLGADLIVVGSSHRGPFGRTLIGDDARAILRRSETNVALAPRGYRHADGPLVTIGVGYNGGAGARAALDVAREIAAEDHAVLRALDVVEAMPFLASPMAGAQVYDSAVEAAAAHVGRLGDVAGEVAVGHVANELVEFSTSVDLLVVGLPRHGTLHRALVGSPGEHAALHSPHPVLLVAGGPQPAGVR